MYDETTTTKCHAIHTLLWYEAVGIYFRNIDILIADRKLCRLELINLNNFYLKVKKIKEIAQNVTRFIMSRDS